MQNNSCQINSNAQSSLSFREIRQAFNGWARKLLPIRQDSQRGSQEPESCNPETVNSDAEFLGWQKTRTGEFFALYNITAVKHPLYRSTVTEKTLRQQCLQIPPTSLPPGPLAELAFKENENNQAQTPAQSKRLFI
jgi:hypothetical protein